MAGPARVFISYSSKDSDVVTRLKDELKRANVEVWLDHEQLQPGTQNWTRAVRRGIEQATDVVYTASPDAADSEHVGHELAIARDEGKRVLHFWIRGEKWSSCAPMGHYYAQYIDARGAAYSAGLTALLAALGAVLPPQASVTPIVASQPARPAPELAPTQPASQPVSEQSRRALPHRPSDPRPAVPARLAILGFRGVNLEGTPAILTPLVSVAAGRFLMGSDQLYDKQAGNDEMPRHRVELATYQIGKYPVTVAEYAQAVTAGAVREPSESGRGTTSHTTWQLQLQRLDHPVVCVSWQDANAYIAWLRQVTGDPGWRLPTEAQWEKAARWDVFAKVSHIYPWGDRFDKARCNTREGGIGHTMPVGSYPADDEERSGASPCGVEDMAGNLWEWTSSLHKPYKYVESDGREAVNAAESRVLRGGCWNDFAEGARTACRFDCLPDVADDEIGFRLIRVSPGSMQH